MDKCVTPVDGEVKEHHAARGDNLSDKIRHAHGLVQQPEYHGVDTQHRQRDGHVARKEYAMGALGAKSPIILKRVVDEHGHTKPDGARISGVDAAPFNKNPKDGEMGNGCHRTGNGVANENLQESDSLVELNLVDEYFETGDVEKKQEHNQESQKNGVGDKTAILIKFLGALCRRVGFHADGQVPDKQ